MTWKQDYKRAVLRHFLDMGQVEPSAGPERGPGADGWYGDGQASDARAVHDHFYGCEIDVPASSMLEDTNWTTWGGTFGTDDQHYGYTVTLVCKCGHVNGRKFRIEGNGLAKLINQLVS